MRDVIEEVGLSAGCVYTHFASKHDLVAAIAAERHRADAELLDKLDPEGDAATALAHVGRDFIGTLQTRRGLEVRRVGVQTWTEALVDESIREHVLVGRPVPNVALEGELGKARLRGVQLPHELERFRRQARGHMPAARGQLARDLSLPLENGRVGVERARPGASRVRNARCSTT